MIADQPADHLHQDSLARTQQFEATAGPQSVDHRVAHFELVRAGFMAGPRVLGANFADGRQNHELAVLIR